MSPLHTRGSPTPCILGGPQRQARTENQKWISHPRLPRCLEEGVNVTPAFSGVPNTKCGEKIQSGYLPPAFSGARKRAKVTPTYSRVPNAKRGEKIRSGYPNPAFSGPKTGR